MKKIKQRYKKTILQKNNNLSYEICFNKFKFDVDNVCKIYCKNYYIKILKHLMQSLDKSQFSERILKCFLSLL